MKELLTNWKFWAAAVAVLAVVYFVHHNSKAVAPATPAPTPTPTPTTTTTSGVTAPANQ